MARVAAVALLLALAVPACLAGTCIQGPERVFENEACSSQILCAQQFYCVAGSCKPRLEVGAVCSQDDQCREGLLCRGKLSEDTTPVVKSCVEPVGVGQQCDFEMKPCHPFLMCDFGTNVCVGGGLRDDCVPNKDVNVCAQSYECLGNECTGVSLNQNCTTEAFGRDNCALGMYCDSTSKTCFKRKTSGRCEDDSACEHGYLCVGLIEGDMVSYCTKSGSRKVGEYCANKDDVCEGASRCVNQYCSSSRLDLCTSDGDCSWDETCTCDGVRLVSGTGRCTGNKCVGAGMAYADCKAEFCGENDHSFPGSCVAKHCAEKWAAYNECSAAGSLSASIGLFALIGAVVHMLTRQ